MLNWLRKRNMRLHMNIWPPFLGAGIRVVRLDRDWRAIDVEMRMRFWNANYVGTHYGGSLYSMTDPFYMLMLMENLGREYVVWDKAATVRFKKPGLGTMRAEFRLTGEKIDGIRAALTTERKVEPLFVVEVRDAAGIVIAEVEKVLYVRKKESK
jgi:Domain of unknown function (DUF4442)